MTAIMEIQTTVQVGKSGLTTPLLKEVEKQLKKRKIVKIKFLQTSLVTEHRSELKRKLLSYTKARLVSSIGNVVIIKSDYNQKMRQK